MEPSAFDQLRPGTYDPRLRVDDMNANGVLASLNFPTMPQFDGGTFVGMAQNAPEEALLACRPWHDCPVQEWCAAPPGRFLPMSPIPTWHLAETPTTFTARRDPGALSSTNG